MLGAPGARQCASLAAGALPRRGGGGPVLPAPVPWRGLAVTHRPLLRKSSGVLTMTPHVRTVGLAMFPTRCRFFLAHDVTWQRASLWGSAARGFASTGPSGSSSQEGASSDGSERRQEESDRRHE